ncbi:MAG TPA: GNAT family N-acetyltransferase [Burkholderiales bacterium]|nr:GNAT family N-acetyltransferase [Burkholderiales bacterium]
MQPNVSRAPGVAVVRLNARYRDDIARHLMQLPREDRRLRFGHPIADNAVRAYVEGIDFARDSVFGIHGPAMDPIGVAHLALDPAEKIAELGVSVDPSSRSKGYGFALLQRSVLHAANLGYRVLFMYCLAENGTMMRLAQKAGLTVVIERGEADARLKLDRLKHGGALREAMADQFALVDNMLKQQYLWLAFPGIEFAKQEANDERGRAADSAETPQGPVPQRA